MKHKTVTLVKFKSLSRRLGQPMCFTAGVLECLWQFCLIHAKDGCLSKYTADDLACWMEWPGDPDELIDSLVASRWLDRSDTGDLSIHDWSEHCPNWVKALSGQPSLRRRDRLGRFGGDGQMESAASDSVGPQSQLSPNSVGDINRPIPDQFDANLQKQRGTLASNSVGAETQLSWTSVSNSVGDTVSNSVGTESRLSIQPPIPIPIPIPKERSLLHGSEAEPRERESFAGSIEEPEPTRRKPRDPGPKPRREYPPDFESFWEAYPHRGAPIGKVRAFEAWRKIHESERQNVIAAAKNFALTKTAREGFAKDPERFLKHEEWRDLVELSESQLVAMTPGDRAKAKAIQDNSFEAWQRKYGSLRNKGAQQ